MSKFLYGAAVQGIQSFIFQTNTLREIIGASELVEEICTKMFAEQLGISITDLDKDENAIINAAGNIKYIFDNEGKCKKVFREFPKQVLEAAPGITISQAVIELRDGLNLSDALHELEIRLRKERNMPMQPITLGLMGIQRSRETGLPERYHMSNPEDYCDEGTFRKRKAADTYSLLKKAIGEEMQDIVQIANRVDNFTDANDWIERWFKVKREKLEQQKGHVDRYGVWLALFTWLPIVGDLFAIALGFYRVRPKMSAFYMFVGRFVRFLVWVLLYIRYADRFIEWIS